MGKISKQTFILKTINAEELEKRASNTIKFINDNPHYLGEFTRHMQGKTSIPIIGQCAKITQCEFLNSKTTQVFSPEKVAVKNASENFTGADSPGEEQKGILDHFIALLQSLLNRLNLFNHLFDWLGKTIVNGFCFRAMEVCILFFTVL